MSRLDELLAADRLLDLTQPLGPGTIVRPGSAPFRARAVVDHETHGRYARELERVPQRGAWLVVAALPAVAGSGAPARVLAILP